MAKHLVKGIAMEWVIHIVQAATSTQSLSCTLSYSFPPDTVPTTTTAIGTNLDKIQGISTLFFSEKYKVFPYNFI
jgi:hypothetical protein